MINFYETLRFEVGDEVEITIATHGWIGSEMTRRQVHARGRCRDAMKLWKEDREVFFL